MSCPQERKKGVYEKKEKGGEKKEKRGGMRQLKHDNRQQWRKLSLSITIIKRCDKDNATSYENAKPREKR